MIPIHKLTVHNIPDFAKAYEKDPSILHDILQVVEDFEEGTREFFFLETFTDNPEKLSVAFVDYKKPGYMNTRTYGDDNLVSLMGNMFSRMLDTLIDDDEDIENIEVTFYRVNDREAGLKLIEELK